MHSPRAWLGLTLVLPTILLIGCGPSSFEDHFRQCAQADTTVALGSIRYQYTILGPTDAGRCKVQAQFLANPNPAYEDASMTCTFDPETPFRRAIRNLSRCEGTLKGLLRGGGPNPSRMRPMPSP